MLWSTPKTHAEKQQAIAASEDRLVNDLVGLLTLKTERTGSSARIVDSKDNRGTKKEWRLNIKLDLDKLEQAGKNVFDGSEESRVFVRGVVQQLKQDKAFQKDGQFDLSTALDQIDYVRKAHTARGWTSPGFGRATGKARKVKLVQLIQNALIADAFAEDKRLAANHPQTKEPHLSPETWEDAKCLYDNDKVYEFLSDKLAGTGGKGGRAVVAARQFLQVAATATTKEDIRSLGQHFDALKKTVGDRELKTAVDREFANVPPERLPATLSACSEVGVNLLFLETQLQARCNKQNAAKLCADLLSAAPHLNLANTRNNHKALVVRFHVLCHRFPCIAKQEFKQAFLALHTQDTKALQGFLQGCDNLGVTNKIVNSLFEDDIVSDQQQRQKLLQLLLRTNASSGGETTQQLLTNGLKNLMNNHKLEAHHALAQVFCDTMKERPTELQQFMTGLQGWFTTSDISSALLQGGVLGNGVKEQAATLLKAAAALGPRRDPLGCDALRKVLDALSKKSKTDCEHAFDEAFRDGLNNPGQLKQLAIACGQLGEDFPTRCANYATGKEQAKRVLRALTTGSTHRTAKAPKKTRIKPTVLIKKAADAVESRQSGIINEFVSEELKRILTKDPSSLPQFLDACDRLCWHERLDEPLTGILQTWDQHRVADLLSMQRAEADRMRFSKPALESILTLSPSRYEFILATRRVNLNNRFKNQPPDFQFQTSRLDGPLTQIGSGNANRPYYGKFQGFDKEFVLKLDQTSNSQRTNGIDEYVSTETENILFCSELGKIFAEKMRRLGRSNAYNFAGDTYLGKMQMKDGSERFATVTEKFPGQEIEDWYEGVSTIQELKAKREFMGILRLFDYCTAQTDRNGGNAILSDDTAYLIDSGGAAMGALRLPEDGFDLQAPARTITFTKFQRRLISSITNDDIDSAAQGLGMSPISILRAKERLANLQQMCNDTSRDVQSSSKFEKNCLKQCDDMARVAAQSNKIEKRKLDEYKAARYAIKSPSMLYSSSNNDAEKLDVVEFAIAAVELNIALRKEIGRVQLSPVVDYELQALACLNSIESSQSSLLGIDVY